MGQVFSLFGAGGKTMVPLETEGLRLGQVVSYGDMANTRNKAVVISVKGGSYGQSVIYIDSLHKTEVSKTSIDGIGGWMYEDDEDWTQEQILVLIDNAENRAIEEQAHRKNTQEDQDRKEALIDPDKPIMIDGIEVKATRSNYTWHVDGKETGKLIRKILKKEFPAIKFSVRFKSYSGGASIDISWTDGPVTWMVDKLVKRFEGASFDGMQDLKTYEDRVIDGQTISFSPDFIFAQRETSEELRAFASCHRDSIPYVNETDMEYDRRLNKYIHSTYRAGGQFVIVKQK